MLNSAPPSAEAATSAIVSHRRLLASAGMLGGATLLVKLAAFAKDWTIARQFGASDELDAFLVAFLIPSFAAVVLGHAFAAAFVPAYIQRIEHDGRASARQLANNALVLSGGVLLVTMLAMALLAPLILGIVGASFSPEKLALAVTLFYIMLGSLLACGVSAVFAAILNAHERFIGAALAPAAVPLVTVALMLATYGRWGAYALALGTLLGFLTESVVLAVILARQGLLPVPRFTGLDAQLRGIAAQYASMALGMVLISSSLVVDQAMAASLGSGAVSILNYGSKLSSLVLSLVAVSLSTVLFPSFSRLIATGQWNVLTRTLNAYAGAILLVSLPGVALLALLTEPLIRFFFERGAFTPEVTAAASAVQRWFLPQIPFYVLAMIGTRMLSALQANATVLRIAAVTLLLNIAGNLVFMHWFGVRGIAMSTSLVYAASAVLTYAAIRLRLAESRRLAQSLSDASLPGESL